MGFGRPGNRRLQSPRIIRVHCFQTSPIRRRLRHLAADERLLPASDFPTLKRRDGDAVRYSEEISFVAGLGLPRERW